ncbi:hypothetical protein [Amycolatopsis pretoriensis]|nr:hypothetical protein [Amycolatopsis pretoriensis]
MSRNNVPGTAAPHSPLRCPAKHAVKSPSNGSPPSLQTYICP